MVDHTTRFYAKMDAEHSWPIGSSVVYDKNQIV